MDDEIDDKLGDEMDVGQLCDCVAGGMCRVDTRSATTSHSVHLWWSDPRDARDPDTIASPAHLDQWISSGVIAGAWCPTCQDEVIQCPSFESFLTAQRWDTAEGDA